MFLSIFFFCLLLHAKYTSSSSSSSHPSNYMGYRVPGELARLMEETYKVAGRSREASRVQGVQAADLEQQAPSKK